MSHCTPSPVLVHTKSLTYQLSLQNTFRNYFPSKHSLVSMEPHCFLFADIDQINISGNYEVSDGIF